MIRDITEINFPEYATLSQATVTINDMGEKTITAQVKIDGQVTPDFTKDWLIEFKGERYIHPLRKPQAAKENTSLNSTVDLTFQHWAVYQLGRYYFMEMTSVESGTAIADKYIASLSLDLGNFVQALNKVLDYYYDGSITADLNPAWLYSSEPTTISISYTYIWDLLPKLYEDYGVRWQIVPKPGDNTKYIIKLGYPTVEIGHIFEYGFEGGLLKVERQVQSSDIKNILLGRGGETNLPYRYFKDKDKDNPEWAKDPDWIPELANVYFTELRSKEFREYVRGWKTNPNRQVKDADGNQLRDADGFIVAVQPYLPGDHSYAYERGHSDEKFNPVEFVRDEDSIAEYGEIYGALENNEEIYPSIQGVEVEPYGRIDQVVAVEEITSDDVKKTVEAEAQTGNVKGGRATKRIAKNTVATVKVVGGEFTIPIGKYGNFLGGDITKTARSIEVRYGGGMIVHPFDIDAKDVEELILIEDDKTSITVYDKNTGMPHSASGIPEGTYYFEYEFVVNNQYNKNPGVSDSCAQLDITISVDNCKYEESNVEDKWERTFDIWVKNIWGSKRLTNEKDDAFASRAWDPILGDRVGNEAKVVFSTGFLSISEDYEFVIVKTPVYDDSKTLEIKDDEGNVTEYTSFWRITLAKSGAEYDATGFYIPSTKTNARAGDYFFFTGIDMPHDYVLWAEQRLYDYKCDQLREVADIKPTWVVSLDKVRISNKQEGETETLLSQLEAGASIVLADKRFIINRNGTAVAYETLYLQSITYTYKEPDNNSPAIVPDIEIVLSDKYEATANPVSTLQGEVSSLSKVVGSISNVEQIVRMVGDSLYLRKDGFSDRSMSPTEFHSLITSGGFRSGIVGGQGWGFFKDANGNWVLETDRLNVRQDMTVNNLVVNQVTARGGMIIESAASLELSRVVEKDNGYVCYFDQKRGSVKNLFLVDDIAYSQVFNADYVELKFYKRRVVAVEEESVTLSKTDVNGLGIPEEGDVICHFGNYTDKTRQYVKVRDVVGGGYERYIEGLDSVNATGTEYYFIGKQDNQNPRFYVGNRKETYDETTGVVTETGEFIEWKDGKLYIRGSISASSSIGDKTLEEYINGVVDFSSENIEEYVNSIVDPKINAIKNQIDGAIDTYYLSGVPTLENEPAVGWTTDEVKESHVGDLYYDKDTGKCYIFQLILLLGGTKRYEWKNVTDEDIVKAMEAASTAQDTADGKRRTFVIQPADTDAYDPGDLWVNAVYPVDGSKYDGDILRCVTAKAAGEAFSISHWTLASKYTDDSALNTFITEYESTIDDIKEQVDGKAQTWYQSSDPSLLWKTEEDKLMHKGDLWYCTADIADTNYKKGTTWHWNGTSWQQQDIPDSVFDKIDGKADIYVSKPSSYHVNDLWFLEAAYTLSGVAYSAGTLVVATQTSITWSANHWTKKDKYTDDTAANEAKAAAAALTTELNALKTSVSDMRMFTDTAFSDGIVDRSESAAIANYIKNIENTVEDAENSYAVLYNNELLTGEPKTDLKSSYDALNASATLLISTINDAIADGIATDIERASVNAKYEDFNTKYGTFVYCINQANQFIQNLIYADAKNALNKISGLDYLKEALKDTTEIDGGLVLSSLICLGRNNKGIDAQETYSGISGIYDGTKTGGGIAAWYGGEMLDKFDYYNPTTGEFNVPTGKRPAAGLDRMDGTGYRANGALWWELDGTVHADPLSFFVGEETIGALLASFQVALKADGKNPDYLIPKVPFQSLNIATILYIDGNDDSGLRIGNGMLKWDETNNALYVETYLGEKANFYATGNVAARGAGSSSGGSSGTGGGLIQTVYSYNFLGQTFQNDNLNDTFNAYTINRLASRISALESSSITSVPWSIISDKPTTLAGYGIADGITAVTANSKFVTALGTSGNSLTWTRNSVVNSITVPYATNCDTVDGWHGIGTGGNVLRKSGYLSFGSTALSSYWGKVASFTWGGTNNDVDVTLYLHSAYNNVRGIVHIRARWTSATTTSLSFAVLVGNIAASNLRLYYDASSSAGILELWCNATGTYGVMNVYVLSETRRVGVEESIVTVEKAYFNAVQTPALENYIEATYVPLLNNAATATSLATARKINGVSFNGTGNITTTVWGTARNISVADATAAHTGTAVSVNGSAAVTLKLPSTITAALSGNASTATTLATARTLWGQSFNGSADVSGDMTGVGSITASGEISSSSVNALRLAYGTYGGILRNDGNNIYLLLTDSGNAPSGTFNSFRPLRIYSSSGAVSLAGGALYANHGGNVGIGTTSPSYKLHVSGTLYASGAASLASTLTVTGASTHNGGIVLPYAGSSWITMATNTKQLLASIPNSSASAHSLFMVKTYNKNAICFGGLGNHVGFNFFLASNIAASTNVRSYYDTYNTDSWYKDTNMTLRVSNTGDAASTSAAISTTGSFYAAKNIYASGGIVAKASASDIRLKKDVCSYKALPIIRRLRSVRYRWNELAKGNSPVFDNDYDQYGLIAQDVMAKGFQQFVSDDFKDFLVVKYERLIPILWRGVQETDGEITTLKKEVKKLKAEITQLKKRIRI